MARPSDVRMEFISLLNNKEKELGSERGFLLLVGPGRDLSAFEQACFDPDQTWNSCITARYTLKAAKPEMVLGTLMQQLIRDIHSMSAETFAKSEVESSKQTIEMPTKRPYGKLRDAEAEINKQGISWLLLSPLADRLGFVLTAENKQLLDTYMIIKTVREMLAESSQGSLLNVGQRMVVFVQLIGVVEDSKTWTAYLSHLAALLPYRTMVVISGLPESVELDPASRNQRRLKLESTALSSVEPHKTVAFKENAAISDEPSTDDKLKRRRYANALARMMIHPQTEPPLSIGIYGPWGKGKSSFMRQIEEELKEARKKSALSIVTVMFNAWSYNDASQVWAGLLNKVSEAIEKELGALRRIRLNLGQALKKRKTELFWAAALPLFILFAAFALGKTFSADLMGILKTALGINDAGNITNFEKALLIPLLGGLGSMLLLVKRLATVMQPVSLRIANFARLPNYSAELGFQHTVINDLKFLNEALQKKRANSRVVVFIDDLDRCSEQRIMEVLQAIILVLSPSKYFVILGIDTEMIYRAINQCYSTDGMPPPGWFPRQYLKKILQLSFQLPSIEEAEREHLLASVFSKRSVDENTKNTTQKAGGTESAVSGEALPTLVISKDLLIAQDSRLEEQVEITEEVEDTPYELAAFYDYQECLEDNPREIKRAINAHRLLKFMMQQHGVRIGSWTEQRQRQLVRWVLFCIGWPELVTDALREAKMGQTNSDVLGLCNDQCADKITSNQRRRRLSHIKPRRDDILLASDIDESFIFAAYSMTLLEEEKEETDRNVPEKRSS